MVETHGEGTQAKAYTVSDLSGKREGLGFSQLVAADRLTPVELLPLSQETEDALTRIMLNVRGEDKAGTVKAQTMDGKVYVELDDNPGEQICIDLAKSRYRWLS